jgi:hypothetical protein
LHSNSLLCKSKGNVFAFSPLTYFPIFYDNWPGAKRNSLSWAEIGNAARSRI